MSTTTSSSFTGWPAINVNKKKAKGNQYYQPPTPTLSLQELAPGLFLVPDVFTQQQCRTMIQAAEGCGMEPTNPRNLPAQKGMAFRNNDRLMVHEPAFAADLFEYLKQPVLENIRRVEDNAAPCALGSNFRFYRYVKGAWFGPHIDETQISADRTMESEFTLLLYLTGVDDEPVLDPAQGKLKGGATRFHFEKKRAPIDVKPKTGQVVLHWQLHDCLHEGAPVLGGVKWLLRTDVYYPRISSSARLAANVAAAAAAGGGGGGGGSKEKKTAATTKHKTKKGR